MAVMNIKPEQLMIIRNGQSNTIPPIAKIIHIETKNFSYFIEHLFISSLVGRILSALPPANKQFLWLYKITFSYLPIY